METTDDKETVKYQVIGIGYPKTGFKRWGFKREKTTFYPILGFFPVSGVEVIQKQILKSFNEPSITEVYVFMRKHGSNELLLSIEKGKIEAGFSELEKKFI
ncbi:MAG: hypothetical protein GOU97_04415 [Nanoarchaeota archaeon]|nr:hypothetical protein [Nanoarchaeota archaeon]